MIFVHGVKQLKVDTDVKLQRSNIVQQRYSAWYCICKSHQSNTKGFFALEQQYSRTIFGYSGKVDEIEYETRTNI